MRRSFDHDRRTDSVIAKVVESGEAFFSGTTWRERRCTRVSVCNWQTDQEIQDPALLWAGRWLLADHRFRQMYIQDLGHEEPTILLTNEWKTSPKALITRYAQRMLIENSLSDAVRFFHMNALSSAVGLKVDFDMALLVMATRCSIFGTFSRTRRTIGFFELRAFQADCIRS